MTNRDHVRALDGMRGLAVLIVIGFHLRLPGFRAGFVGSTSSSSSPGS